MSSTLLDILIAAGLLFGMIRGFSTGAIRQITGLAGTVLSIVLGLEFMDPVGNAIGGIFGLGQEVARIIGFVLVFAAGQIILRMLTGILEKSLKALRLSILNRAGGAVFGACKVALLMSVMFLMLGFFSAPSQQSRDESTLYAPVAAVFPVTWNFVAARFPAVRELSDRFGQQVRGTIEEAEEDISPEAPALETEPAETEAPDEAVNEISSPEGAVNESSPAEDVEPAANSESAEESSEPPALQSEEEFEQE